MSEKYFISYNTYSIFCARGSRTYCVYILILKACYRVCELRKYIVEKAICCWRRLEYSIGTRLLYIFRPAEYVWSAYIILYYFCYAKDFSRL